MKIVNNIPERIPSKRIKAGKDVKQAGAKSNKWLLLILFLQVISYSYDIYLVFSEEGGGEDIH